MANNHWFLTALSTAVLMAGCNQQPAEKSESSGSVTEKSSTASSVPAPPADAGFPADSLNLPTMPEMPIPDENPQSAAKIALGNKLFFDTRLSGDGKLSCYSCHMNENGTGGAEKKAIGAFGKELPRHSPTLINVGYLPKLYWDGRADGLEAQVKGAWAGANLGVGKDGIDKKAKELAALPDYKKMFADAFPGEAVTADTVAKAISSYERTLVCKDTVYDKYAAGDKTALTVEQKSGLATFMGKGMCSACHAPPHFSTAFMGEGAFFNVGVGTKDVPEDQVDVGRMKESEKEQDWAAFKPPSLRNISKTAPYFHDGSVATLKDAVTFMASGGHDNKNKTPLMSDKKLTAKEIDELVAFLAALDCSIQLEGPKNP